MLRSIAVHSKEATQGTFLKRPKASTLHPPRLLEEKWWIMFYLDFSELSTLEKNKKCLPREPHVHSNRHVTKPEVVLHTAADHFINENTTS